MVDTCLCTTCKSYTPAAKSAGESLYCGQSSIFGNIKSSSSCICSSCAIGTNTGVTNNQFCTKGNENTSDIETNQKHFLFIIPGTATFHTTICSSARSLTLF